LKIHEYILSRLFVQLTQTNYYKIVKDLKSFKIRIIAPTYVVHTPTNALFINLVKSFNLH